MIRWVTGASGFIGRHVVARALAGGDRVAAVGGSAPPPGVGEWVPGLDLASLDRLAAHGPPEVVVHLAGGASVGASIADPHHDFERTVAGTAVLLEWLRTRAPAARVVVASSAAVYGAGYPSAIGEDAAVRPFSPYGHHKAAMELLCRSAAEGGQPVVVARLFSVFGPNLRKQLLWDLCRRLARGEAPLVLGGTGGELRDWTTVDDVAAILMALGDHASAPMKTVNVGSGVGTTVAEIARMVAAAWGGAEIVFDGIARPGDPERLVADPARLDALGLRCQAELAPAIDAYVDWFRSDATP